jgi:steroid delta-isomerase-like uncharacterized protein
MRAMTTTTDTPATLPAGAPANLERVVTALNAHDAAGFAACFAPDGVMRIIPLGETLDRAAVQALIAEEFEAFPDWQLTRRGLDVCGACIWAQWTFTGTHAGTYMGHAATHRAFELHGCSRFAFAPDGSITEESIYFDPATVLRQLGLAAEA